MQFIRIFMVAAVAFGLSACATQATTASRPETPTHPEASANKDAQKRAEAPERPASEQASPEKAEHAPAEKAEQAPPAGTPGQKSAPVPYVDYEIQIALPDESWRPVSPKMVGSDADGFIINGLMRVHLYLWWMPYEGGDDLIDLEEIGLKMLEIWAKDDQAVNEAPVSWADPDGNRYVMVTGTFVTDDLKVRRCYVFRQVSRELDFAVGALGIWPDTLDPNIRPMFDGIVDSVRGIKKEPVKTVPSGAQLPAPMPLPLPGE